MRIQVLAVDIGGTTVKILASGQKTPRLFPSGAALTPQKMVARVKEHAGYAFAGGFRMWDKRR